MKSYTGKEVPDILVENNGFTAYKGIFGNEPIAKKVGTKIKCVKPDDNKLLDSIEDAIKKTGLKDGMTISFHHHFRNGDYILNMVVNKIAEMGIKNISLATSSLSTVHEPLIEHIKNGVITNITTSGMRGKLAEEISKGIMENPIVIRSHGGRARAIESGNIHIDVAFLGVPCSDNYGNANGFHGKAICGSLGYAQMDAKYAENVVLITDSLVEYPNMPASICQTDVDYVVKVDEIGDPNRISEGATRFTKNPKDLLIADYASKVIINSDYFKDGFSFQTGSGGASLAVTRLLRKEMEKQNIKAKFALGGITKPMVELLEAGLIENLFDVQSFDLVAAESLRKNKNHHEIDASLYANPFNKGCMANKLDIVILSALEIDTDFNVNVITGSDGVIRGASGGHSDTAASAKLSIIVAPLIRGRISTVVDKVNNVITPGNAIDILVTDRGVAINKNKTNLNGLEGKLKKANIPVCDIEELREMAEKITGVPEDLEYEDKIVGLIEYRDGSLLDVIKKVK